MEKERIILKGMTDLPFNLRLLFSIAFKGTNQSHEIYLGMLHSINLLNLPFQFRCTRCTVKPFQLQPIF